MSYEKPGPNYNMALFSLPLSLSVFVMANYFFHLAQQSEPSGGWWWWGGWGVTLFYVFEDKYSMGHQS